MFKSALGRREFLRLAGQSTATMALTGYFPSLPSSPIISPPLHDSEGFMYENSLDVKIGQMLLVGFRGLKINHHNNPIVQDIRDYHLGGILLFNYDVAQQSPVRNIQSPPQVKALIQALQSYSKIPLLVTIDYEGGKVNRLSEQYGFPPTVSHQYLGHQNDLALTRHAAHQMAKTLKEVGINLNYAPVVDVNTNPNNPIVAGKERSFSADPYQVAKHALEFIRSHHQENILCTLKHFPGHGSSRADSHLGMVDVTDTWSRDELIPYQQIIQAGEADAIMTAHVFNRSLDPQYPATLSKPTITGLLRGELGFNQVVFSDDMQMKAIANHYGLETAVQKVIEAGVDILVVGNNTGNFVPDIAKQMFTTIKNLVQNGTISEARIEESYQRILRLKHQVKVI